MRSFLEFVSCCVTSPQVSRNEGEEVVTAAVNPAMREETGTLMPPKVAALTKKKRVRVGTPGVMAEEWKPSLNVISEDNVVAEKREKTPPQQPPQDKTTADRVVKRKSSSGSRSKVHVRSNSDDIGRNPMPAVISMFSPTPVSMPVVIPTFSPTPFMF
ncbi:Uncharacterized protein TCM_031185 isoform 1 [Theobroma cacao]|uniref:Uncharacterized protein isoform 1 n=2 Tax=Theobroma cacao TaxID=3641 RepID=A0A061F7P4_THECC|nr:Uncharacterized protein TCM_031185 isoform 1 [Theobroma cacao]